MVIRLWWSGTRLCQTNITTSHPLAIKWPLLCSLFSICPCCCFLHPPGLFPFSTLVSFYINSLPLITFPHWSRFCYIHSQVCHFWCNLLGNLSLTWYYWYSYLETAGLARYHSPKDFQYLHTCRYISIPSHMQARPLVMFHGQDNGFFHIIKTISTRAGQQTVLCTLAVYCMSLWICECIRLELPSVWLEDF